MKRVLPAMAVFAAACGAYAATAALSPESRWIIERHVKRLDQVAAAISEVEHHLDEMTRTDVVVRHLESYKGIGPVTAWTIRAEVGRFDRFRSGKH